MRPLRMRDLRLLVVLLIVPVLVATAAMWALRGTGSGPDITRLRAAIVNLDEGAEVTLPDGGTRFVPFGRQFAAELTHPADGSRTFAWELMRAESARAALEEGTVAATVTIPKGFSQSLATLGTAKAVAGRISVETSPANQALMDVLADLVTRAAADALGEQMTSQMLDGVYSGLDTMRDGLLDAQSGALALSHGSSRLADGAAGLADGSHSAHDGALSLADGLSRLTEGTGRLVDGTSRLSGGLPRLREGAHRLADGAHALSDGVLGTAHSPGLVDGLHRLDEAMTGTGTTPGLAAGSRDLATGARELADGVSRLHDALAPLRPLLPTAEEAQSLPVLEVDLVESFRSAREVALLARDVLTRLGPVLDDPATAQALGAGLDALVTSCPRTTAAAFCADLEERISQVRPLVEALPTLAAMGSRSLDAFLTLTGTPGFFEDLQEVQDRLEASGGLLTALVGEGGVLDQFDRLADGASSLAQGAEALADGVNGTPSSPGLASGIAQVREGGDRLADGLRGGATTPGLAVGADQLAAGVDLLADGADGLGGGIRALDEGAVAAGNGSVALAQGLAQLAKGSGALADGVPLLTDGADQLADGLASGARSIPRLSEAERSAVVSLAVRPVEVSATGSPHAGVVVVYPFVVPVLIWLLAFGAYLMMPGLWRRAVARPIGAMRVVIASLRIPALVWAAGVVASWLLGVLFGVRPVAPVATAVLVGAAALVALLAHQMILACLGDRVGRVAALLLLVVQLVALIALMPFQGAPEAFAAVNAILPLGEVATGLQASILGVGGTWGWPLLWVLAWGVVCFTGSVVAVSMRRGLDVEQVERDVNHLA